MVSIRRVKGAAIVGSWRARLVSAGTGACGGINSGSAAMGMKSKTKGKNGEREIAALLSIS